MTATIIAILTAAVPGTVASIIAYQINKKSDKRYEEQRQQAIDRAEASKIQMEMITASAALSYACAMALKRGKPNGEVEEAIASYALAKKNYLDYINRGFFEYREGVK